MTAIKKIRLLVITTFLLLSTSVIRAQINAGGALAYGTEIETLGFNLRGGYLIGEKFNLSAGFNYFLPKVEDFTVGSYKATMWEFNLNGSYWLHLTDDLFVYPLVGLNITSFTYENVYDDGLGNLISEGESDVRPGLNAGGGIGYKMGKAVPFLEGKYVISDYDQAVFSAGVIFLFN